MNRATFSTCGGIPISYRQVVGHCGTGGRHAVKYKQTGGKSVPSVVRPTLTTPPSRDRRDISLALVPPRRYLTLNTRNEFVRRSDEPMARVTVEDCIDKVENRFELVLL